MKTKHDNTMAEEPALEAGNQGWTRELPIRSTMSEQPRPAAAYQSLTREIFIRNSIASLRAAETEETDELETEPMSEEAQRITALVNIGPEGEAKFVRLFLELSMLEQMEKAYVAGAIQRRKNEGVEEVPEDVMDRLRKRAREVSREPLDAEDVAFLDDLEQAFRETGV